VGIREDAGYVFKSHKHIEKEVIREHEKTQEGLVVISGVVECSLYDIDDTLLTKITIADREVCFTLQGGHGFTVLEDYTYMLEFKSCPYQGQSKDKVFI
jgi:hypothetical protein